MKYTLPILFLISLAFIAFVPQQNDFPFIVGGFAAAFLTYFLLLKDNKLNFRNLLILAFIVRFMMLFAFPWLSDDIYRFIWDGTLLHDDVSPYQHLPSEIISQYQGTYLDEIYSKLNSREYYSVYPPLSQAIFYLASFPIIQSAFISSIIIKIFLFGAEIISIVYGIKLLKTLGLAKERILWYALNPLVIVEIMGNAHFEGLLVCFFILFLYTLKLNKENISAIWVSFSIAIKLIPLIFLPFFLFKWKFSKFSVFYGLTGAILVLIFFPVLLHFGGFSDSVDLYFRKFEFNASLYYLFREIGRLIVGYNPIGVLGPSLAIIVAGSIFYIASKSKTDIKSFVEFCLISLTIYLSLSTTIHPWYLSLGVMLSIFTGFRYMYFWSALVILSYSKYWGSDASYYIFVSLEYLILFGLMYREFKLENKISFLNVKS